MPAILSEDRTLILQLTDATDSSVNATLFASSYTGLSNNSATLSAVVTNCNTGNCTWPPYPSLGICANVVDISDRLSPNPCNPNPSEDEPEPFLNDSCFNYTLQSISGYSDFQFTNLYSNNLTTSLLSNSFFQNSGLFFAESQSLIDNTTILADFIILHQPLPLSLSKGAVALECKLEFCVQIYETSVRSGNTTTIMTAVRPLLDPNENNSSEYLNFTIQDQPFVLTNSAGSIILQSLSNLFYGDCMTSNGVELSCDNPAAQIFGTAANQNSDLISDIESAVEIVLNNTGISMTNA